MHCLHCVSEAVDIIKRINTSAVCVIKIERKMKKKKKKCPATVLRSFILPDLTAAHTATAHTHCTHKHWKHVKTHIKCL